jgi:FMN-dependent NADH-azoreductase
VEHLVSKERITTHAMRMKFYSDKHLDEVTDMDLLEQHIPAQEKQMLEIVRVSCSAQL